LHYEQKDTTSARPGKIFIPSGDCENVGTTDADDSVQILSVKKIFVKKNPN
jgi:hypothetical protein